MLTHLEVRVPSMYFAEAKPLPPAAFYASVWPEDLLDHPVRSKTVGGGGEGSSGKLAVASCSAPRLLLCFHYCAAPPGPQEGHGFVTVDSIYCSGSDEGGGEGHDSPGGLRSAFHRGVRVRSAGPTSKFHGRNREGGPTGMLPTKRPVFQAGGGFA